MTNCESAPMRRPSRKRVMRVALNAFTVGLLAFGCFTVAHRCVHAADHTVAGATSR